MNNPAQPLHCVIRCRLDELARLHEAVDEFCRRHDLPKKPVAQLQLALEEHVTNIIRHGRPVGTEATISVHGHLTPGELRLEVSDPGPAFNPLEHPLVDTHRPLDERPLGGLGVHLMRHLTDRLEYRREGARNILSLHKRFTRDAATTEEATRPAGEQSEET